MAGKTDCRFVTVSFGGTAVTCSITSATGIGITRAVMDITTLCNDIMESIKGVGTVNIGFSGPYDNSASGAHTIVQPLADGTATTTVLIEIGDNAVPTTGDPTFTITNAQIFDYIFAAASGSSGQTTWSAQGGENVTAAWGIKS